MTTQKNAARVAVEAAACASQFITVFAEALELVANQATHHRNATKVEG